MNLAPAWQKGYTGKGVVVSILDDGIQTNHPDLAQNYVSTYNYEISLMLHPLLIKKLFEKMQYKMIYLHCLIIFRWL